MTAATFSEEQKRNIRQRMQTSTPRFLFRSWHDESGGSGGHNTTESITPRRFREQPSYSRDFFNNDIQDLVETAKDHLDGGHMPQRTVYSSWTHSLPQAFDWTCYHFVSKYQNLHMCVLDTKQLPSAQVVLHTRTMHELISTEIPDNFEHEFLVYGPIEGPAYKAVSVEDIQKADLDKFYPGVRENKFYPPRGMDFAIDGEAKALLSSASNIGQLFDMYSVPVQAHLLACVSHIDTNHQKILEALESLDIPEDWLKDPDAQNLDVAGHVEAQRAATILRDLAKRAHDGSAQESTPEQRQALQDAQVQWLADKAKRDQRKPKLSRQGETKSLW